MSIDEIIAIIQTALANPIFIKYGFYGLFATSVLSATAIPFPSEITAFALVAGGDSKLWVTLIMAAGWTAGGYLGYYIGRGGSKAFNFLRSEKNKDNKDSNTADGILRRFGWLAIFGSAWIPFIGDFIPMVAGAKKYDLKMFIPSLAAGKVVKAFAVIYFGSFIFGRLFG